MIQVSRRRCCHGNPSAKVFEQHWPRDSGFGNRTSQRKAYAIVILRPQWYAVSSGHCCVFRVQHSD